MKQKSMFVTILVSLVTTYANAQESQPVFSSNQFSSDPTVLAVNSEPPPQSQIEATSADGQSQTTIIDAGGNLKMIEKGAAPPPAQVQFSEGENVMPGSNPSVPNQNQERRPNNMPPGAPPQSNMGAPGGSPQMGPPSGMPQAEPGLTNQPQGESGRSGQMQPPPPPSGSMPTNMQMPPDASSPQTMQSTMPEPLQTSDPRPISNQMPPPPSMESIPASTGSMPMPQSGSMPPPQGGPMPTPNPPGQNQMAPSTPGTPSGMQGSY